MVRNARSHVPCAMNLKLPVCWKRFGCQEDVHSRQRLSRTELRDVVGRTMGSQILAQVHLVSMRAVLLLSFKERARWDDHRPIPRPE